MRTILLSRDEFREQVLLRDNYRCVICGQDAQDAHHIMERRLFNNGGYYIDNGASLCRIHHINAEKTIIGTQELRDIIGINNIILPKGYYRDTTYDKWGNIILSNGQRIKGELFYDESVQKVLSNVLYLFTDYIKYPRTKHLPWSKSINKDDDILFDTSIFHNKIVVVTEKMDGENATIYSDGYFHARSLSGNEHPSQSWIKNYIQKFYFNIPKGWRICGENLYAKHSIYYDNLDSYFQVFSIWNEKNECLNWEDILEYCNLLELSTTKVLYIGIFDRYKIHGIYEQQCMDRDIEGYVIRIKDRFHYTKFQESVAKYVRKDHIKEDIHNWRMRWNISNINQIN